MSNETHRASARYKNSPFFSSLLGSCARGTVERFMGAGFWYLSSTQVLPTSVQESPACRIARFWPLVTSRVLISYGSVLALTLPFLTTTVEELLYGRGDPCPSLTPPFFRLLLACISCTFICLQANYW